MARPKKHRALSIRHPVVKSKATTPALSPHSSAHASEDETSQIKEAQACFRFLELPSELRIKIYSLVFSAVPSIVELDPSIFALLHRTKALALFSVSRQIYQEASHNFFSTHTFRLFSTYPGRYLQTKRPLLARLTPRFRNSITSLQLRLGPGWKDPPRGWVVNETLGLSDCVNVRVFKVFVECDPSDAIYKGFRLGDGFYEEFSARLMDGVLKRVPSIEIVEFDAWPGVTRTGDMMLALSDVVEKHGKITAWGPERGWQEEIQQSLLDGILLYGGMSSRPSKTAAILA